MRHPAREPAIVRVLDVAAYDVVTVLEQRDGALCVTRYYAHPVMRTLDAAVRDHVTGGATADLPPGLADRLAGYRLRAGLGALPGVPALVTAGVRRAKIQGLAPLAAAYGNAFVAVHAHAGSALPELRDALEPAHRRDVLVEIIRVVRTLHDRGVAHGRLAPGSFAVAGRAVTLVDVEPLHASGGADPFAPDRAAVATIADWLLGATAPGPLPLHALWHDTIPTPLEGGTVAVPDAPSDGTMFVPDDD